MMKIKLVKKEKVASNIVSFYFSAESKIRYIAGQYIELTIPHVDPDERKANRWFTLSSSPTEELLTISTRIHPSRSSSFKKTLSQLKPGSLISAQMPMGDFVLPKDVSIPLIFVARGIGITPYRSILKFLQDTNQIRNITLIYTAKNSEDIAFEKILQRNTTKFIKHFDYLDTATLLEYTGPIKDQIIYVSGPEKMVEDLQKDLINSQISPAQIRTDFFHNYD